jgi:hypothetical protein
MNRRNFLTATAAAGMAAAAPPQAPGAAWLHLTWYYMRNGTQVSRTNEYLREIWLPAARRAQAGPIGIFQAVIAEQSPFALVLAGYPSLAAFQNGLERMEADPAFQKGWDAYNDLANPEYVRMESSLLRAFRSFPAIEAPADDGKRPPRIFELRTYESVNEKASLRKIGMFENGEIAIFRKVGMVPVFFGRAIIGERLPKICYLLSYDSLEARERLWRAFGSDPEWQKLRSQPRLSDAEIVSNISNSILRPAAFSPIR